MKKLNGKMYKAGLVRGVCASAMLLAVANTAYAQDANDDVIVVTGVKASLEKALDVKRDAPNVVDAISAEDIGEFPDENLAESLQRITGVQITRARGEGQGATVRGLPSDFTLVQYNGRNLASATGNRSFDFTILSSDFVSSLEVSKSPTANQSEGGIAGSININTIKPLDVGSRKINGSIFGQHDSNAGSIDPKLSIVYTDVSDNGRFGFTVGGTYNKRSLETHLYQAFGLEPADEGERQGVLRDYNVDGDFDDTGFAFNHAANFGLAIGERERISGIASMQFIASDSVELYADALLSSFETTGIFPLNSFRFTNIEPARVGDPAGIVGSTLQTINGRQTLVVQDADAVDNRNNARQIDEKDKLVALAVGADIGISDKLSANAEIAYSKSTRRTSNLSLEVIGRASVEQDLTTDMGGVPSLSYSRGFESLVPSNLRAIGMNGAVDRPFDDEIFDVSLEFDYDLSDVSSNFGSLTFGGKYSEREQFQGDSSLFVGAEDLAGLLGQTFEADVENGSFDASDYVTVFEPSNFLNAYSGSSVFPTTWISADPRLVLDQVPLSQIVAQFGLTSQDARVFTVNEETLALYAMADFGFMEDRLTGNLGVRYVDTTQVSSGNLPDLTQLVFTQQGAQTLAPVVTPQDVEGGYSKVLPNLNLRFDVSDDIVARFSAARVMSRAALAELSPATSVNLNVGTLSRSNPNLGPQTADQFDASLEWYFTEGGLISATGFSKNITDLIIDSQGAPITIVGTLDDANMTQQSFTVTPFFPDNSSEKVSVKGLELSYQQPFTFLPAPFDGFGVIANYTYVDIPAVPLADISKNSYNLVGYYENDRFSTRLAYNYRSGYPTPGTNYFGDGSNVDSYGQLDGSFNYNINDNLSAVVEAINITESAVVSVNDFGINRGFDDNGRRVMFGLRGSF